MAYTEQQIKEMVESVGYKYYGLESRDNARFLLVQCDKGHEPYWVRLSVFKGSKNRKGNRCPLCKGERISKSKTKSNKEVKKYVEEYGYKLLKDYTNCKDPLYLMCPKGHEWITTFDGFKNQSARCMTCEREKEKGLSFGQREKIVNERGYKLLSVDRDIQKNRTFIFITIECPKGHISKMKWDNFQQQKGCKYCNESKGEKEIYAILNNYSINHMQQYKFNECKCKQCLPFDFYLPDYNCCIEFDGEQHYKIGCFNGDMLYLLNVKYRDNIKTKYCEDNNIKLIRIPYWDFDNIEEILKRELEL